MAKENKMYSVNVRVKKHGYKTKSLTGLSVALNPTQASVIATELVKKEVQKIHPNFEDECFTATSVKLVKEDFFVRHDDPLIN